MRIGIGIGLGRVIGFIPDVRITGEIECRGFQQILKQLPLEVLSHNLVGSLLSAQSLDRLEFFHLLHLGSSVTRTAPGDLRLVGPTLRPTGGTGAARWAGLRVLRNTLPLAGLYTGYRTGNMILNVFGLHYSDTPSYQPSLGGLIEVLMSLPAFCPKSFSIRKFSLLSLFDRLAHGDEVFIREVPEHGDRGLVFELSFGLHNAHDHVGRFVVHTLGDKFICQEQKRPDVRLLTSTRIGGKLFIELKPLPPENPLKLKLLEKLVTIFLLEPEVQFIRDEKETLSLPDHSLTRFLIPDHRNRLGKLIGCHPRRLEPFFLSTH